MARNGRFGCHVYTTKLKEKYFNIYTVFNGLLLYVHERKEGKRFSQDKRVALLCSRAL